MFGIYATIDGTATAFASNLSVTNAGGVVTVQADDSPSSTHWTLQVATLGRAQTTCVPMSNPSITYTHYTAGVADSVYSTKTTGGSCTLNVVDVPVMAGDRSDGNFFLSTLVRDADAGGGTHTMYGNWTATQ